MDALHRGIEYHAPPSPARRFQACPEVQPLAFPAQIPMLRYDEYNQENHVPVKTLRTTIPEE
jgi:hypothetical protein